MAGACGFGIMLRALELMLFLQFSASLLIKSSVFLSPKFVMKPGSVVDRYYYNIEFPKGHIGVKSFNAEVVDEDGNPVSLQDTYLHHWAATRYYQSHNSWDLSYVPNSGVCQKEVLRHYYGTGSETRKTSTDVPDPYGVEVGNPSEIPEGHEEIWMLNVHAIDTRGVVDRLGCTECRCDLYNVTNQLLLPGYTGGLYCCHDQTRCKVKEGFEGKDRVLYMRYTVKWVEWDDSVVPVDIYIFDVTDEFQRLPDGKQEHNCLVEYEIHPCEAHKECIDTKRARISIQNGGHFVYGVAHQHSGGVGVALYGEDGRLLCSSLPIYGEGNEPGNEDGYIVGMSTCYPTPGFVSVFDGENLLVESNYTSTQRHTGVMGLFHLFLASPFPEETLFLH